MKKVLLSLLAVLFIVGGCGSQAGNEADALQKILDKGELIIGTSPDYPPYEFPDANGNIIGFDISLAERIADELGVNLVIKDSDFDGVLASIATGMVDLGISGLSPTPKRRESMDFSDIYYTGEQAIVFHKDNINTFTDVDSIADALASVQLGSIQYDVALDLLNSDSQIRELKTLPQVLLEVVNGNTDIAFISKISAEKYIESYPDLVIADFDLGVDAEGSSIGVPKGNNSTLIAKINEIIANLLESGEMEAMMEQAILDSQE